MLIQNRTLAAVRLSMKMLSFLKACPYSVDSSKRMITPLKSNCLDYKLWLLNFCVSVGYSVFVYGRFYYSKLITSIEDANKIHFALHIVWMSGVLPILMAHIAFWRRKYEIAHFVNSLMKYIQKNNKKFATTNSCKFDFLEFLLQILPISPWISVLANFATPIFYPASPQFILSLFSEKIQEKLLFRCFSGIFQYIFVLCIWIQGGFLMTLMVVYFKVNLQTIKYFRNIGTLENFNYRSLQVLNMQFLDAFSDYVIFGFLFALYNCDLFYGVVGIHMFHQLPIFVLLLFPIVKIWLATMVFFILKQAGYMEHLSRNTIDNFKHSFNNPHNLKIERTYLASCPSIIAKASNFQIIRKESAIAYLSMVMSQTTDFLILMD